MIQKAAFEKIKGLNAKEMISAIKIIDLDTKVFAEKTKVALVFKIDGNDIHTVMTFIN